MLLSFKNQHTYNQAVRTQLVYQRYGDSDQEENFNMVMHYLQPVEGIKVRMRVDFTETRLVIKTSHFISMTLTCTVIFIWCLFSFQAQTKKACFILSFHSFFF